MFVSGHQPRGDSPLRGKGWPHGVSASASPSRSPHLQGVAMSARFRTPVGALLEHCRSSSSTSAPDSRSASSVVPFPPANTPSLPSPGGRRPHLAKVPAARPRRSPRLGGSALPRRSASRTVRARQPSGEAGGRAGRSAQLRSPAGGLEAACGAAELTAEDAPLGVSNGPAREPGSFGVRASRRKEG